MNNLVLYLACVLIWGSTWLAITFQLGHVPPAVSVVYRFTLAGVLLLGWCLVRRLRLAFPWRDHLRMALQGALLFGLNYVCVYLAESRLTSGLVAVVFSLIVFLNIVGTRMLFGKLIRPMMLVCASAGVIGVALIFLPELQQTQASPAIISGLAFAVVGTVSACAGNLVAAVNYRRGLPVLQLNLFGMLYGAGFVGLYAWFSGNRFVFDPSLPYVASLLYLAVFGSIAAFGAYLTLLARIGPDRAGYTGVATPVVAMLLSVAFEGLKLHPITVFGMVLGLAGNALALRSRQAAPADASASKKG